MNCLLMCHSETVVCMEFFPNGFYIQNFQLNYWYWYLLIFIFIIYFNIFMSSFFFLLYFILFLWSKKDCPNPNPKRNMTKLQKQMKTCLTCCFTAQLPALSASKEAASSTMLGSSGSQTWNPTESSMENMSSSIVGTELTDAATPWPAPVMMEPSPSQNALRVGSFWLH